MPKGISPIILALKVLLGGALFAYVVTRVPLSDVRTATARLTPGVIAAAVALYFAAHGINAARLRVLLPSLTLWQAWRFTMIGILFGTALPGSMAGDAVKAFRLARAASDVGDITAAVAAVTVDKMIGMFALLILTALGIGLNTGTFGTPIVAAAGMVTILAPLALTVLLATPVPARLGRWGEAFSAWRQVTLSPAALLKALGLGFISQGLSIAVFAALGQALGITLAVSIWAVILGLISVILLLPITVAGLGLRDGSLVAVLALLGQAKPAALALSLSLLALNLLGAAVGLVVDLAGRDSSHSS